MEIVNLGNTKLHVSRIGMGTAAIGRPGYINIGHDKDIAGSTDKAAMMERSHGMFDIAYTAGIRYFDTARSYGEGEAFLAEWIHARGHNDVVIGSKWGYIYTADWQIKAEKHEVKDHSLSNLQTQYAESKGLLDNKLNLYQIHSATLETGVLDDQAVLNAISKIKQKGIRVGLTLSGNNQGEVLNKALKIKKDRELLFDTVQATFNVLEQSVGEALKQAYEAGMGIIIKEGVANGRLTDSNKDETDANILNALRRIGNSYNADPDTIALAYILHQPWAQVVLSGASTPQQLRSNALAESIRLNNEDLQILRSMAVGPDVYWDKRSQLVWN
ncbi:MAG: aldo/keto reductase [Cyclobacteriaceae bacterium]